MNDRPAALLALGSSGQVLAPRELPEQLVQDLLVSAFLARRCHVHAAAPALRAYRRISIPGLYAERTGPIAVGVSAGGVAGAGVGARGEIHRASHDSHDSKRDHDGQENWFRFHVRFRARPLMANQRPGRPTRIRCSPVRPTCRAPSITDSRGRWDTPNPPPDKNPRRPQRQVSPYSLSLRYSVRVPMPSIRAACSRLPAVFVSVC